VHPTTIAPRRNYPGAPHVSKMPADLWLIRFQDLRKETDAHLIVAHEVE
jgi:hypothetical protein